MRHPDREPGHRRGPDGAPAGAATARWPTVLGLLGAALALPTAWATPTSRSFEHWSLECHDPSPGRSACSLFQNVVLAPEQGGGRVMRVTIGLIDDDPDPVALFVLPLGISLPPGVELEVEGIAPVHFPVERCEPSGCGGGLRLDASLLGALERVESARVRFRDSSRQPVELTLSLRGFQPAIEALRASTATGGPDEP
jgi:invasion protein IalB